MDDVEFEMYRRDFGVVLLSIFAIYWSLQHEGAYEYKEAFFYSLSYKEDLGSAHYPLPPPVVVRFLAAGVVCAGPIARQLLNKFDVLMPGPTALVVPVVSLLSTVVFHPT